MTEPKPCPFCGEEPEVFQPGRPDYLPWIVICTSIYCRRRNVLAQAQASSQYAAVRSWNKRSRK